MLRNSGRSFPESAGAFAFPRHRPGSVSPRRSGAVETMGSGESRDDERERDRESERYRRAALEALGQLEWCVDYLYRIRKSDIAKAISRNRNQIIRRAGL
jgi:hypothetical protein